MADEKTPQPTPTPSRRRPPGRAARRDAAGTAGGAASRAAGKATTAAAPPTSEPPSNPRSRPPKASASRRSAYTPAEVAAIFARLAAANPEPRSELHFTSPYTLLVAVVLSAQATDAGVNKATARLFPLADTPAKMVALGEAAVEAEIKTIGLFRAKAKNVVALSQMLIDRHGGAVPADRAALEALPGVGRKTANVVLNVAFGEATIAVDTHIFRIGNRLGLAPGRTPEEVEAGLEAIVPAEYRLHAHHWLILHGRYICVARTPRCGICPIYDLCKSPEKRAA